MVLDSVGIGDAPDAADFGDEGADTLGHIAAACASGRADREGLRGGPLHLPHLTRLGLARLVSGLPKATADGASPSHGLYGSASEVSKGKDTPSGHWEIAGVPVTFDWGYFPQTIPTFPASLIRQIIDDSDIPGILGDRHASGTEIITELGEESVRTGKPIFYTSSDSVLQIAAHETHFGLKRLLALCEVARRHCDPLNIGRSSERMRQASRARRIGAISRFHRPRRRFSTVRRRRGVRSSESARSLISLPIKASPRSRRAPATWLFSTQCSVRWTRPETAI